MFNGPFWRYDISGYCPEALALFSRMDTQPNNAIKTAIDNFIKGCVEDGNWLALDVFQVHALNTVANSKLNWCGNYNNAVNHGCGWAAYIGFQGDANLDYLDTTWIPNSSAKYLLGSGAIGGYGTPSPDAGILSIYGTYGTLAFDVLSYEYSTGDVYSTTQAAVAADITNFPGFITDTFHIFRDTAAYDLYIGNSVQHIANVPESRSEYSVFLAAGNNGGYAGDNSIYLSKIFYAGGSLNYTTFKSRLDTLIAALGL